MPRSAKTQLSARDRIIPTPGKWRHEAALRDQYLPNGLKVRVYADASVADALRQDWSHERPPERVRMPDGKWMNRGEALEAGLLMEHWPRDFDSLDWLPGFVRSHHSL